MQWWYIDGLTQDFSISSALVIEMHQAIDVIFVVVLVVMTVQFKIKNMTKMVNMPQWTGEMFQVMACRPLGDTPLTEQLYLVVLCWTFFINTLHWIFNQVTNKNL